MPGASIRPAADPLDAIDRDTGGADTLMGRQDRADLPGERSDEPRAGEGDIYTDAARELSERSVNPRQEALDADRDIERAEAGEDADDDGEAADEADLDELSAAHGVDDDDPIDETERAGD